MAASGASADPQVCIALNQTELQAGHSVYLFSSEFGVVDPASRDAALQEWEKYAESRGFESTGCDPRGYKEELAALPGDAKVLSSDWKPSRDAVLAGALAISAGKRNFRNASACVQNISEAIANHCEYPVKVGFCFGDTMSGSGDAFDKTCRAQNFGTTQMLAAGAEEKVGTYHYVYYFACEAPAEPQHMYFDGNGVSGVCSAP
jgi:hypothetical protein